MRYFKTIMSFFTLFLFYGCASYEAVSLPKLQPEFTANARTQNNVTMAIKVFSKDDCRRYYDKDIIELGYLPIQISVYNETKNYYQLSMGGINQPVVLPEEVAKKAYRSTTGRAAAYGTAGICILHSHD
ncbi:MAG: hypothetical protein L7F78_12260 [Syntrophales bacterium LBB04]|nr:hypothetical protein [Syntrophales bacterium LBB04]